MLTGNTASSFTTAVYTRNEKELDDTDRGRHDGIHGRTDTLYLISHHYRGKIKRKMTRTLFTNIYIYNVISIEGVAIVYGTKISHRVESDSSSAYHVLIVSNKESYIYYSTVKYVRIFKVIYIRYFLHSL